MSGENQAKPYGQWVRVQIFSLDQKTDPMICRVILDGQTTLLSHDGVLVAIPGVPVLLAGVVLGEASLDQVHAVEGQIKMTGMPIIVQRIPIKLRTLKVRIATGLKVLLRDLDEVPSKKARVNHVEVTGTLLAPAAIEAVSKTNYRAFIHLETSNRCAVTGYVHGHFSDKLYHDIHALMAGQSIGLIGALGNQQQTLVVNVTNLEVLTAAPLMEAAHEAK